MKIEHLQESAFVIHDFLSENECRFYIEYSERCGFHQASVQHPRNGPLLMEDIRNNDRVNIEDSKLAEQLFHKAKMVLPPQLGGESLIGLNHRLRFYRYGAGQYFKWHRDGHVVRSDKERSLLTFLIYLNDEFTGGETEFRWGKVATRLGTAVIFPHRLVHQGANVQSGIKYVLRTDVMYSAASIDSQNPEA